MDWTGRGPTAGTAGGNIVRVVVNASRFESRELHELRANLFGGRREEEGGVLPEGGLSLICLKHVRECVDLSIDHEIDHLGRFGFPSQVSTRCVQQELPGSARTFHLNALALPRKTLRTHLGTQNYP